MPPAGDRGGAGAASERVHLNRPPPRIRRRRRTRTVVTFTVQQLMRSRYKQSSAVTRPNGGPGYAALARPTSELIHTGTISRELILISYRGNIAAALKLYNETYPDSQYPCHLPHTRVSVVGAQARSGIQIRRVVQRPHRASAYRTAKRSLCICEKNDYDIVPGIAIVKKVELTQHPEQCQKYYLRDDSDKVGLIRYRVTRDGADTANNPFSVVLGQTNTQTSVNRSRLIVRYSSDGVLNARRRGPRRILSVLVESRTSMFGVHRTGSEVPREPDGQTDDGVILQVFLFPSEVWNCKKDQLSVVPIPLRQSFNFELRGGDGEEWRTMSSTLTN
ncbi:hypothetical protein EVAR_34501_1 [Eumeta japonica]|uniref:Uncharacterized protein n=1 Tax=Eumeta variegata TaxID=151549 RepID=A0A4C1Z4Q6_EUMVA|nr:hypothetical protein EVAR_34501_1 [Eumeta japonica]